MNIFFISGTDTNVGKTEITCALMRLLSNQDKIVMGMKPIFFNRFNFLSY